MKGNWRAWLPAGLALWGGSLAFFLAPQHFSWGMLLAAWLWLVALCWSAGALHNLSPRQSGDLMPAGMAWTVWGALTLLLMRPRVDSGLFWWLGGLNVALALLWGLMRGRAAGEVGLAVWGGFAAPAWLYGLIRGGWHPWLLLLGLPLTLAILAALLAWGFATFSADQKQGRRTLVQVLGWQAAADLHHALLLAAFAFLGLDLAILGLPWRLLWPLFLVLPLAFYQMVQLRNITLGLKPLWDWLRAVGLAIPLALAYLLTVIFLIH